MRRFILLLLCSFFFISINAQKAPLGDLDLQRDGKYYQRNHIEAFTGTAFENFKNGKKKHRADFKDGKLDGKVTTWHETGEKSSVVNYKQGVRVGTETHWYPTGVKKLEVNYDAEGKATGICKEYHDNEQISSEGKYEEGREVGLHKWYFKDGKLDQTVVYDRGLAHGKVMHYYQDGTTKMDADYKNGQPDGTLILFHKNGKKKTQTNYIKGYEEGEEMTWSSKGILLEKRIYEKGETVQFMNYRSGALKTKKGYLQVFNEKESFFSIHLNQGWIRPKASRTITYVVDKFVLQLLNTPLGDFSSVATDNHEDILNKYMNSEIKYIKKETGGEIEVDAKYNPGNIPFMHWSFESPGLKDVKNPSSKTVIKEHYFSLVCGKQILSLYVPQTKGNDERKIMRMVKKMIGTTTVENERIDLNELKRQIRENAGLPLLRADEKFEGYKKNPKK